MVFLLVSLPNNERRVPPNKCGGPCGFAFKPQKRAPAQECGFPWWFLLRQTQYASTDTPGPTGEETADVAEPRRAWQADE